MYCRNTYILFTSSPRRGLHHLLPLLLLFLTLAIEAEEGTTTLETPTEAVLFRPATQNVNEMKRKGLCEVRNAKKSFRRICIKSRSVRFSKVEKKSKSPKPGKQ